LKLKVYRNTSCVELPEFATKGSACFDLAANLAVDEISMYDEHNKKEIIQHRTRKFLNIHPGHRVLVPTGLIFDIPQGYSLRLHPRSSLAWKKGLSLANCEGIIDSDYVDPTFVVLYNFTKTAATIVHGERLCQAELVKSLSYSIEEISDAPGQKTDRQGGLGSTGKH